MKFCSVHTHSILCDGKNTIAEMARAAFAAGAVSFGASGHSHTQISWDEGCVLPADPVEYRDEVLRLRKEYRGRMDVLLGIEWDSQSDQPPPDWADYWIGSVHNVYDEKAGVYHCVDWDENMLEDCCREMYGGDYMAMVEGYYEEMARVAAMGPTILGHFDGVVKLNRQNRYFDEESARYASAALEALHTADPKASLLEINTGAIFRGYRTTPYPAPFLLREWRKMGGRIIFTADAHSTAGIACAYAEAAELAKAEGFTEAVLLTRAGPLAYPL
jgi:histidinol-phosphatase (PHP family)